MALLRIRGNELRFSIDEFDRLAGKAGAVFGNRMFKSELEPLRTLLTGDNPPPQSDAVLAAIDRIPLDKRQKYKVVIDYVVFHWPNVIPNGAIRRVANPRTGNVFGTRYVGNRDDDNQDLVYGLRIDRGLAPYAGVGARYCDAFNNTALIGNGKAFGREWWGRGELGTRKGPAREAIGASPQLEDPKYHLTEAARQAHVTGLIASRLDPVAALGMDAARVRKDMHLRPDQIRRANQFSERDLRISRHLLAHARMVKSVRRACKGGIAMIASLPLYRSVGAKVHFVLDGCGDLGAMAMKMRRDETGPYVAITTSELAFCHRFWNDQDYPLANVVSFYVNGEEVLPPWEADWEVLDYSREPVISNQEAWLRYALTRSKRSAPMPFPRF